MSLLAFYSDPAVKEKYLARVRAHQAADELIHGTYWENGKGCAVGCTIHGNDHYRYETELGIPEWLARLEDTIFENLANGQAKSWPAEFLEAIPIGVDLSPIKWKFCAFLMRENIERVLALKLDEGLKTKVIDALRQVLAFHESADHSWSAWAAESAARAAESAARSARAAESAGWSARAAESAAGWSARAAGWSARAAESAARAAESAESAWAAESARAAAFSRYKIELLRLLKEAK